jgi:hypothetical protein
VRLLRHITKPNEDEASNEGDDTSMPLNDYLASQLTDVFGFWAKHSWREYLAGTAATGTATAEDCEVLQVISA